MTDSTFEDLASRPGVARRETVHEVGPESFADTRAAIDAGLSWAVGGIVPDERDRILLVKEGGCWLAPGGEVEAGESHTEALVREVREETGVDVSVGDPVAATEVVFVDEESGEDASFYFAHYTATPTTTALADDPGLEDEDIERVRWADEVPAETVDRDVIVANSPAESL